MSIIDIANFNAVRISPVVYSTSSVDKKAFPHLFGFFCYFSASLCTGTERRVNEENVRICNGTCWSCNQVRRVDLHVIDSKLEIMINYN